MLCPLKTANKMSTHIPHLSPGLSRKREFAFLVCALLGCLIFYLNKEKRLSLLERTLTLISNSESFSPFLPLPGGRLSALWLTAAPPSVCRPLTYSADEHSRAWGVLAAWHCSCLHVTHCEAEGQDSPARPNRPLHPVLSNAGDCRTRRQCHDRASELKCLHPPQAGIHPPPD